MWKRSKGSVIFRVQSPTAFFRSRAPFFFFFGSCSATIFKVPLFFFTRALFFILPEDQISFFGRARRRHEFFFSFLEFGGALCFGAFLFILLCTLLYNTMPPPALAEESRITQALGSKVRYEGYKAWISFILSKSSLTPLLLALLSLGALLSWSCILVKVLHGHLRGWRVPCALYLKLLENAGSCALSISMYVFSPVITCTACARTWFACVGAARRKCCCKKAVKQFWVEKVQKLTHVVCVLVGEWGDMIWSWGGALKCE